MAKRLYVVGLGPGDQKYFTVQARAALEDAQVLCGYTVYVDLVSGLFPDKETYTTPMRREIDRCRWALEMADSGRIVALVCSGDAAGIWKTAIILVGGFLGQSYERSKLYHPEFTTEYRQGNCSPANGG